MVKHVILWTLKYEYSEEQKKEIKDGIKAGCSLKFILLFLRLKYYNCRMLTVRIFGQVSDVELRCQEGEGPFQNDINNDFSACMEVCEMSERWQLNLMTIALAIGIVLVWITWDPKIVVCCMALSVLRLGALFYEYPELQIWRDE